MNDATSTDRLAAPVVLAIFVGGIGILTAESAVLLAAIVPLGYVIYSQLTTAPPLDVTVSRAVDDETPAPGAAVTVTVTVENTGAATIPKCHVIDGVPAALGVVDGTARHATALQPGEAVEFSYTVVARRGVHAFGETYVNGQSFSGGEERETGVAADGATELTCRAVVGEAFDPSETHQYSGQRETNVGGTGIEFYSTRDHQHGDPVSRIDWNRYARDGDLTTIEYRERKGVPTVLVVDLRSEVDVARRPADPPASELGLYAANRLLGSLLDHGNVVGTAFYADDRLEWLPPNRGDDHVARAHRAFREAADREWSTNTTTVDTTPVGERPAQPPSGAATAADGGQRSRFAAIEERLPASANLVVVTPVTDGLAAEAAQYFEAFGHSVTVLSPTVTGTDTLGQRVDTLDREMELDRTRATGAAVVTWDPNESLGLALAKSVEAIR